MDYENKGFYLYDYRMLKHIENGPEKPLRISSIHEHLKQEGILKRMDHIDIIEHD